MAYLNVGQENSAPIELYYEDVGAGKPVVLIHGWPLSGRSWENQVMALVEAGYRVITYDRRGFGQSSQPFSGYDYDTLAADLNTLIETLDLKEATLVGFSMGGGEVARFVGNHGTARLERVVFAAAVPPYLYVSEDNPDGGLDDATIASFEDGVKTDRAAFFEDFSTNFFSTEKDGLLVSEANRVYHRNIAWAASPKGTLDCIAAFGRTDFRDDLKAIDVPVLVIHGDADGIVPLEVSGKRTADSVADGSLHVIEGGPHGINATHAQAFNEALIAFLN
ncbi:alpha/beta hydrolase [uncultured Salinisphaera sp.]|uniref:alpha/beta fold hydrolase n=1 Tax=uncultured Salinisphaera sp. TaxID=359372 RepID=UPI0032B1B404|tara:strand:- start:4320 stop:5153 length:834 start_codon:yes stop_codon:yes gene_type:complete